MWTLNLALTVLQFFSVGGSLPVRPADTPQENRATEKKTWTNADLDQFLSRGLTPKAPGEKVWTNADLEQLRDEGLISIIGPVEEPSVESAEATPRYDKTKDPEWYAAQAGDLGGELDYWKSELGRFLQALQSARDNKYTTNGVNLAAPVVGVTPDSAIQLLEQRVQETQSQLDDLEDLARSNGIASGVLRGE